MKFTRRRTKTTEPPEATPAPTPTVSSNGFDPAVFRPALFQGLANRVGEESAALMREDFDRHIASDPINGVEQAYYCLTGKLVDYVDILNGTPVGMLDPTGTDTRDVPDRPIDFTVFRKEG